MSAKKNHKKVVSNNIKMICLNCGGHHSCNEYTKVHPCPILNCGGVLVPYDGSNRINRKSNDERKKRTRRSGIRSKR